MTTRQPTKRRTRVSGTHSKVSLVKPWELPIFGATVEATGFNPDTPLVLP